MQIPDMYLHTIFQLNIITDEILQMMLDYTFPMEKWKVIDYEDIVPNRYEISSYGRIRILEYEYIVKQHLNYKGYLVYTYPTLLNKKRTIPTHRIVGTHFVLGQNEERNQINHKDTFKINNFYQNLEWVTNKENNQHAIEHGLVTYVRGENHGKSIITDEEAIQICKLIDKYEGDDDKVYQDIIHINPNIPRRLIQEIRRKDIWNHISDKYLKGDYYRRNISKEEKQLIINTLTKNNMDQLKTQKELQIYPYETIRHYKRQRNRKKK